MGNPRDLGITIVEGTYNGLVHDALYDRVHFSGAINPGMSGGPTLTGEGRVVGVNVATMGNQVGFLVPVDHARVLLKRALAAKVEDSKPAALLATVRTQLLDHQQLITERLLATPLPQQTLGSYRVPGRWLPVPQVLGRHSARSGGPVHVTSYQCSSEDGHLRVLGSPHGHGGLQPPAPVLHEAGLAALRRAATASTTPRIPRWWRPRART